MPPATARQSTSKASQRAYYHNKQEFSFTSAYWSGILIPSQRRGKDKKKRDGCTDKRASPGSMMAKGRDGAQLPQAVAASSTTGCIINSAGKDFMWCTVCQISWRKAGKVPYSAYFVTFCLWIWKGTQWARLADPVRKSLQHWSSAAETRFGG